MGTSLGKTPGAEVHLGRGWRTVPVWASTDAGPARPRHAALASRTRQHSAYPGDGFDSGHHFVGVLAKSEAPFAKINVASCPGEATLILMSAGQEGLCSGRGRAQHAVLQPVPVALQLRPALGGAEELREWSVRKLPIYLLSSMAM